MGVTHANSEATGSWVSVETSRRGLVVMAGETLTYLSGGQIPAALHRVTKATVSPRRFSFLLFDPELLKPPCLS